VFAWQLNAGDDTRSNGANAVEGGTPQDPLQQGTIAPSMEWNSPSSSPPSLFSERPSSYSNVAPSAALQTSYPTSAPDSAFPFGDILNLPSGIPFHASSLPSIAAFLTEAPSMKDPTPTPTVVTVTAQTAPKTSEPTVAPSVPFPTTPDQVPSAFSSHAPSVAFPTTPDQVGDIFDNSSATSSSAPSLPRKVASTEAPSPTPTVASTTAPMAPHTSKPSVAPSVAFPTISDQLGNILNAPYAIPSYAPSLRTRAPSMTAPSPLPTEPPTTAQMAPQGVDNRKCPSEESKPFWDLSVYSDYVVRCTSNAACVDYETQYKDTWGVACCSYPQCVCAVRDPQDPDVQCLSS
jgi:hypothetical protein